MSATAPDPPHYPVTGSTPPTSGSARRFIQTVLPAPLWSISSLGITQQCRAGRTAGRAAIRPGAGHSPALAGGCWLTGLKQAGSTRCCWLGFGPDITARLAENWSIGLPCRKLSHDARPYKACKHPAPAFGQTSDTLSAKRAASHACANINVHDFTSQSFIADSHKVTMSP